MSCILSTVGKFCQLISSVFLGVLSWGSNCTHLLVSAMSHEFLANGHSTSVLEGNPVLLPCSIESVPPAHISWQRDSKPLSLSDRLVVRIPMLREP